MNVSSQRIGFALLVLLVALAGSTAVRAEADEDVYVYTNADLESLEPIPTQDEPLFAQALEWDEVQAFIADHYGRLQTERRYQIERSLTEDALENRRPRYGLALAPWGYWGRGKSRAQRVFETEHTDYANRIVPLHARTSLIAPLLNSRARNAGRIGNGRDSIPVRQGAPRGSGRNIKSSSPGRSANGPRFNTATEH